VVVEEVEEEEGVEEGKVWRPSRGEEAVAGVKGDGIFPTDWMFTAD